MGHDGQGPGLVGGVVGAVGGLLGGDHHGPGPAGLPPGLAKKMGEDGGGDGEDGNAQGVQGTQAAGQPGGVTININLNLGGGTQKDSSSISPLASSVQSGQVASSSSSAVNALAAGLDSQSQANPFKNPNLMLQA